MTRLQGQDPFYVKFLVEHRELHKLVAAIEDRFAVLAVNGAEATRSELSELLSNLLVRVRQHFAEEEAGGVLEEATSRLPRLGAEAAIVERQHEPLLRQLAEIVQQAHDSKGKAGNGRSLADAFGRFAYALRAHEAAENRIADEAFGNGYER